MQCKECSHYSDYTCKCENVGVCRACITTHVGKSKGPHSLANISILNTLFKCDICNQKFARLRCLCQDEKKKFCEDCVRAHLDLNMSHCIEPISSSTSYRDIFKSQEKRRKLEYLSYEIRKSLENLETFKEKVKKSRELMIKTLQDAQIEALQKSSQAKGQLNQALASFSYVDSEEPNDLCEAVMRQVESEDLMKKGGMLTLIEASIQSDNFLKSLNSHCKVQFSSMQGL